MVLSDKILDHLFNLSLPNGVVNQFENLQVLNPYKNATVEVQSVIKQFYHKYYNDLSSRKLILGINPGRLGAGATGIPFTDTKRLNEFCNIQISNLESHEPSSVFMYQMIDAFGGANNFYQNYYISSVCPLGFVKQNQKGNHVNYNYYDDNELFNLLKNYLIKELKKQISWGLNTKEVFCLGTGKNFKFLSALNKEAKLFDKITPLEHPRYIVQYKSKQTDFYVNKFITTLG